MSDRDQRPMNDGWTVERRGYTPAKTPDSQGNQPPSSSLGTPPSSGSAVSKPALERKG